MADACGLPPKGWWCSRLAGHEGPCAARPLGERIELSPADSPKAQIDAELHALRKLAEEAHAERQASRHFNADAAPSMSTMHVVYMTPAQLALHRALEKPSLVLALLDAAQHVEATPYQTQLGSIFGQRVVRDLESRLDYQENLLVALRARADRYRNALAAIRDRSHLPLEPRAVVTARRGAGGAVSRVLHVALSVDVDRFPDAYMRKHYAGCLRRADGTLVHWRELRALCAEYRAKGFAVFPPCDNTNPDGTCAGHEEGGDG